MGDWPKSTDISSLKDLENWCSKIALLIKPGMQIGLIGQLGAGKTTLVRLLLKALGSKDTASSPSFVLSHEYQAPNFLVEHWDLYRLASIPLELMEPPTNTLRIIEWINKFPEFFTSLDIVCEIKLAQENGELNRTIVCKVAHEIC